MPYDHAGAHAEFEKLPPWAKTLVLCAQKAVGHGEIGVSDDEARVLGYPVAVHFRGDERHDFLSALGDLVEYAKALTAPDPSVYREMPALEGMTATNVVEIAFPEEEEDGFDQPCRFGHRVGGHAVYCHNDRWPGSPRKCRRSWYTRGEVRDEDCPGYAANPRRGS